MISVIGYHTTKFGELWNKSLYDLVEEVIKGVLKDTNMEKEHCGAIFIGNMLGGVLENNLHSGAKVAEILDTHIPVFHVESACASGGIAFNMAVNYITAGKAHTVIVVGAEKMTDFPPDVTISGLSAAASGDEQEVGLTFPGLYAMLARVYMETYGYTEEDLAYVSVKNHYHGFLNEYAHFRKQITIEDVLKSPYVASPLKVLDSSPISDGASALIISSNHQLVAQAKYVAKILSSEVATDSISLKSRKRLDELLATKIAADKAFDQAKIDRKDISVAELHDCFSIAELLAMEDLGFWKKGTAGKRIKEYETMHGNGNGFIVNTSGGLKAAGHPVGATGVKQIGEVYLQLTGRAGKRQVKKSRYGLAHNVGGSGGTAVVTILGN